MGSRRSEDQRAGCGSQRGPVHLAAHIGDGMRGAQRQSGVRRNSHGGRQAGDDIENDLGPGYGVDLGNDRVNRQRVTGDQTDDVDARFGLSHQRLRYLSGFTQRGPDIRAGRHHRRGGLIRTLARNAWRRCRTHRGRQCGADDVQHGLGHVGVGENQGGIGQHGARTSRQQTGVART